VSVHGDKFILAVDLGTSGPKVALASSQGEILDSEIEQTDLILLPNGGAEQDPDDWWAAIVRATQRLLQRNPAQATQITAMACTSQWSGTVPVDKEGRHLMNAVIWMDARGAPHVRRITGGPVKIEGYGVDKLWHWVRLTGGIPTHSGKDSIAHILFIKEQFPEIYRQTYKFLEPKDYLNLRLTGQFAASPDSITLHWVTDNRDINNVHYSERLIRMCGIDGDKLPPLKPAVATLGVIRPAIAQELGLSEDVQVIMGTPDVHSAAVGSGAVRDFDAHLYIGTSSWLTCHVPFKKTDLFHNMASLPSALPGRYFIVNEQETAGACLAFIRDNILYHEDELASETPRADVFQLFDRVIEQVPPGSDGVIFTPWLNGERTPVDDHLVRGGFHNLSLKSTRLHFLRAVFEGVAFNSRWLLTYVEKFAKRRFDRINMIGGGANSAVWCQIHADVLNRPICQVKDPIQANARGAALLAAVGLGFLNVEQIPNCVEIVHTYEPNPGNRAIYDEMYRSYVELYNRNHKIYARLNATR
jgi:xylulokinase